jgi:hypothetical protein
MPRLNPEQRRKARAAISRRTGVPQADIDDAAITAALDAGTITTADCGGSSSYSSYDGGSSSYSSYDSGSSSSSSSSSSGGGGGGCD